MKAILTSIAAACLLAAPSFAQPRAPRYSVIDLGTLGGSYSSAFGLNNSGVVAGGAATSSQTDGLSQTAFLWYGGLMINLGTLSGSACPTCNSEAGGPNANGVSALISETAQMDANGQDFCGFGTHRQCLGATWKAGVWKALLPLPGGHNSQAYWINNHDTVVGFSDTAHKDTCAYPSQVFDFQAVLWSPRGDIQPLSPLPGDTVSFGFGVNDNGEAVGASGLCSNTLIPPAIPAAPHAVLWRKDGTPVDLGSLGGTVDLSTGAGTIANSINNRGQVVGGSALPGNETIHAFLWPDARGKMQDLGTLDGDFLSVAPCCKTINEAQQIVGASIGPNGPRAFLWENGKMMDLNALIPENSPWTLQFAESINDPGEIVGFGLIHGETHAFLATPR